MSFVQTLGGVMLDKLFLQVQRDRLLRRSQEYWRVQSEGLYPPIMLDHKAVIAREIIPIALSRIETGSYGTCVACGEEIQHRRLELIPAALYCVTCAVKRGL